CAHPRDAELIPAATASVPARTFRYTGSRRRSDIAFSLTPTFGLAIPHKSACLFSIPTGLYPPAQGCEARATLGCIPESFSTLKGLQHGACLCRAAVVQAK